MTTLAPESSVATLLEAAPEATPLDALAPAHGYQEAAFMPPEDASEFASTRPLRWSDDEYARLTRAGFFNERRVELLEGELYEMAAMEDKHYVALIRARRALTRITDPSHYFLSVQAPIKLAPRTQPEPDISVHEGREDEVRAVPTTALLVVEVSDSTLVYDQKRKKSLYARYAVPEYWVLNLIENQLEVSREPIESPSSTFGWNFKTTTIYRAGESVSPAFALDMPVAVADLLPLD